MPKYEFDEWRQRRNRDICLGHNPVRARTETEALEGYPWFNKVALLNRGWTRATIKKFLGDPDSTVTLRRWPQRPECRYERTRVLEAERALRGEEDNPGHPKPRRQEVHYVPVVGPPISLRRRLAQALRSAVVALRRRRSRASALDRKVLGFLFIDGMRQADAAKAAGVSQPTVSRIMRRFVGEFMEAERLRRAEATSCLKTHTK
jgi:hypothetical protein